MKKFFVIGMLTAFSLYAMEKEEKPTTFSLSNAAQTKITAKDGDRYWILSWQAVQLSGMLKSQVDFYESSSEVCLPGAISIEDFDMFVPYLQKYAASQGSSHESQAFAQELETMCIKEPTKLMKLARIADALDVPLTEVITRAFSSCFAHLEHLEQYFQQETSHIDGSLKLEVQAPIVQALLKDHPALIYWLCRVQACTDRVWHELGGHTDKVNSAVFNKQGDLILTASDDGTVRLRDAKTLECIVLLQGHTAAVVTAFFNEQGTQIVTASSDCTARVWDLTGTCLRIIGETDGPLTAAKFNQKGDKILTLSNIVVNGGGIVTSGSTRIWNVATGACLFTLTQRARTGYFDEKGTRIITFNEAFGINIWDASTGSLLLTINNPPDFSDVEDIMLDREGTLITTSKVDGFSSANGIRVWDTNGAHKYAFPLGKEDVSSFGSSASDLERYVHAFVNHRGDIIAVAGDFMKTVRLFDTRNGSCFRTLSGHTRGVYSLAFSQDGTLLVTLSCDKVPRIWDIRTGQCILTLKNPSWHSSRNSIAFNNDGSSIVTTFGDSTPLVWSIFDPKMKKYLLNGIDINQALLLIYAYECAQRKQSCNLYNRVWSEEEMLQLHEDILKALVESISITGAVQLKKSNSDGRCQIL